MVKERQSVKPGGAGGFLNSPTHPEHDYHVATTSAFMSLSSALEYTDYPRPEIKAKARRLLDAWSPLPIDTEDVQDWIHHVLGYYRGCYRRSSPGPDEWNVSNLQMDPKVNPMLAVQWHAGVNLIRKYYPDFEPTQQHFDWAYWGTKPTKLGDVVEAIG